MITILLYLPSPINVEAIVCDLCSSWWLDLDPKLELFHIVSPWGAPGNASIDLLHIVLAGQVFAIKVEFSFENQTWRNLLYSQFPT